MPYLDFAKWVICLALVGASIWELVKAIRGRHFMDGLLGIVGIIITIMLVPWIFKA